MLIPEVDRQRVLEALATFDAEEGDDEGWLENRAHRYAVLHDGRRYPVKRVISLATGAPVRSFSGGQEANRFLRSRGFEIVEIGERSGMFRQRLIEILENYASEERGPFGKDNAVYQALQAAADALSDTEMVRQREELRVKASAGTGNWASVPWITLLDKRETTSTQHGVYVVYLFREDMSGVYLTFNQGVTELHNEHGAQRAKVLLEDRARTARAYCRHLADYGFDLDNSGIDLRTKAQLGKRYETSTIAHKFYPSDGLPDDEALESDLDAVLRAYEDYLANKEPARPEPEPGAPLGDDLASRLELAQDWIRGRGYYFEPWQLATFVAAAKTKPFVILAGVSGTGKSKLPQLLGKATGADTTTLPVRPDWTDSTDLLGYQDLHGRFQVGSFLRVCRDASERPDTQAVCVIDEMNLARVEYYFAEVLSRIESDASISGPEPLITQELREEDEHWQHIVLPSNLLIVGTVNMDESTHGFSKKVLDRAFTLEFSRVSLSEWETGDVATGSTQEWSSADWAPRARRLGELTNVSQADRSIISSSIESLEEANAILQQAQLQVGYRVRDELALFQLHAAPLRDLLVDAQGEVVDPLDIGLTMKLLPRISGGSNLVRRLLQQLLGWAWQQDPGVDESKVDAAVRDWESAGAGEVLPGAHFPHTSGRLCLMWQRLQSEGFTSYWL